MAVHKDYRALGSRLRKVLADHKLDEQHRIEQACKLFVEAGRSVTPVRLAELILRANGSSCPEAYERLQGVAGTKARYRALIRGNAPTMYMEWKALIQVVPALLNFDHLLTVPIPKEGEAVPVKVRKDMVKVPQEVKQAIAEVLAKEGSHNLARESIGVRYDTYRAALKDEYMGRRALRTIQERLAARTSSNQPSGQSDWGVLLDLVKLASTEAGRRLIITVINEPQLVNSCVRVLEAFPEDRRGLLLKAFEQDDDKHT